LFKEKVGSVNHVDLFKDGAGNLTGFGVVEFDSASMASEAIRKMNHFKFKRRRMVVEVSTLLSVTCTAAIQLVFVRNK
jgi:RNA recognition motif-containing protein